MIDKIGLTLFIILIILGSVWLGAVLAVCTKRLLFREPITGEHLARIAFVTPLVCATLYLGMMMLPGESLQGDLDVPLANGWRIAAERGQLDCAYIYRPAKHYFDDDETGPGCMESFGWAGPLVASRFSRNIPPEETSPGNVYTLFDPRNGETAIYSTLESLEAGARAPVFLEPTAVFCARDPGARRRWWLDHAVLYGFTTLALLCVSVYVVRRRFRHPERLTSSGVA